MVCVVLGVPVHKICVMRLMSCAQMSTRNAPCVCSHTSTYRLRIATCSAEGEVMIEEDTGLKHLVLGPDEEQWVLSRSNPNGPFPVYVSMNFCVTGLLF